MNLKLYGFKICPFVERTRIVLAEKAIACESIHVDIRNKPDWFLKISPLGKVPVLVADEAVIFESTVINEFLDEISGGGLHPSCSIRKAQNRSWIEWGSGLMADAYYMTLAPNMPYFHDKRQVVEKKLTILSQQLHHAPYFNGDVFSLIDIAYAPLFKRFDCLKRLFNIDLLHSFPVLQNWSRNLLCRQSVQTGFVQNFDEEFNELLAIKGSVLA